MARLNDITGIKFGKLTVVKRAENDDYGRTRWQCECECGNKVIRMSSIIMDAYRKGKASHCGCSPVLKTHGLTKKNKRLYWVWAAIIQRCENKNSKDYKDYGGRGIRVCKEWREDFSSFHSWAMESGYKQGLSIDRINNNKGYYPGNCRWVGIKEQMNNQSKSLSITWKGETKSVLEWSEETGINYRTLKQRVFKLGWDIDKAMTTKPILGRNQHGKI